MGEIKIRCPKCGKILRLIDNPNINNAVFACPVCNEKSKVGDCQRIVVVPQQTLRGEETQYSSNPHSVPNTEETRYTSSPSGGEETQIIGTQNQIKVGRLTDNFGRTYQLSLGINTIGRKANTSTATIQICVEDRTMSRNHAIVEVRNAGGQIVHILRNGANKNPSYFNGTLVGATDQLILNNGDRVKLGSTELTFIK